MDFLDPKKKRSHTIRLYVGYVLVAIALLIGTILLWYFSFGFNFDPKTKTVVQNGLLFLDSHPESAQVVINGKNKGKTDTRLVLPAGQYNIQLQRDGYREWKHNATLEGGIIERFIYPFMFPESLKSEDSQLFSSAPSLASESPDRRWLITQQPESFNSFNVADLNSDALEFKPITLPTTVLTQTGPVHTIKVVEWSTDNRHALLKHVFEGGHEYIIFDRESAENTINLSRHFGRPIGEARLRDKKYDRYYFHDTTTGDIVSAVLQSKAITQVAQKVVDYQPHGADMLLYVTTDKAQAGKALVKIKDKDNTYDLREIGQSKKYLLDLAQFDGKWYVAAGASSEQKVYVYINPFDALKDKSQPRPAASVLLRLNSPIEYLSFSNNTRFIVAQSGSNFAVYDAENKRQFRYDTKLNLAPTYEATWMDGHRLTAVSDGKLRIFDFDGTNMQELLNVNPAFIPFFDRDYKKLYTVGQSVKIKDKSALVLTDLVVKPE